MFEYIYIYDLETFKRNQDNFFEPYSSGFTNLDDFYRNYKQYMTQANENGELKKDESLLYTHIQ